MIRVFPIVPSATRTATFRQNFTLKYGKGLVLLLNITAIGGTPTLDIKLQWLLQVSPLLVVDINGALFTQKTAVGQDVLVIYPGVTPITNRFVSAVMGRDLSLLCTIGGTTPSFTFSVTGVEIPI